VRFLNKGRHIASLTGEKITEHQVITSLHTTAEKCGLSISHFRFFPKIDRVPHYLLYIERDDKVLELPAGFAEDLDKDLQARNVEYALKRSSGRLAVLKIRWVKKGAFSERQKRSHRPEQFKPVYLDPDPKSHEVYEETLIS
jgi:hypothetical protein